MDSVIPDVDGSFLKEIVFRDYFKVNGYNFLEIRPENPRIIYEEVLSHYLALVWAERLRK